MLSHFLRTIAADDDPNFRNVTLLLPGNGTNGAQNNTFIDSSTNNFTVTRNGNTTQGTFTPYGSNWSNYFDGAGDFLSAPDNTAFEIGSNSFTVEAWVFLTAYSTVYSGSFYAGTVFGKDSTTSRGFQFNLSGTASSWTGINCLLFSSNTVFTTTSASFTFNLNTWYHLAWVRNGTTVRIYVNGVDIGGGTNSVTVQNSTPAVTVGALNYPSFEYYVPGYISNFRFLNGTALYTTDFTPPTQPLTAITNTSLLTCQSNRLIDNSSNNFTVTRNGDVSVQRFSPFNPTGAYESTVIGGSGYFDGNGDYLASSSNALIGQTGNFTAECWFYSTTTTDGALFYLRGNTGSLAACRLNTQANAVYLLCSTNGSTWAISSGNVGTALINAWNHVAVVRNGGTFTVYLNGASVYSSTAIGSGTSLMAGTVTEFGRINYSTAFTYFTGYISNTRITNSAVYTANFTPPTAPLAAITNTSFLLNFTNAGIIDNAMMNDLETVGNAQISTAQSVFGGASMLFDGSGDYLDMATNPNMAFGTRDFTVEFWIYRNGTQTVSSGIVSSGIGTATAAMFQISFGAAGNENKIDFRAGTTTVAVTANAIPDVTWTHVAVVRSGTTVTIYVNGTSAASGTASNDFSDGRVRVGVNRGTSAYPNMYLDDLRITKGIARYTTNFTPPVRPFPTR